VLSRPSPVRLQPKTGVALSNLMQIREPTNGAGSVAASPVDASAVRFAGLDVEPDVAVLIVSHQSASDLGVLLDSLRAEACDRRVRVVVADNASTDGSVDIARAAEDVILVETGGNLGYAAGLNAAMSHVGEAPTILVLNPDVVLEPGCIAALEHRMRVSRAGIVVPRMLNADGAVSYSLRYEPSLMRTFGDALLGSRWLSRRRWPSESLRLERAYALARRIDWATGAAMLVDRQAWDAVGQWDERFFLYSEETDFFHRARREGFDVWFEPTATVRHRGGGSGSSDELRALMRVNQVRYVEKHRPRRAWLHRALLLAHEELRRNHPTHAYARRVLRHRARWSQLPAARYDAVQPASFPSASVIIPAHNESSGIARTLAPLAALAASGALEVIVACNGCSDDTADIAARFAGVTVIELPKASKAAAMNAGDEVATRWPRLYLDANTEVDPAPLAPTIRALAGDGIFAARPAFRIDAQGASVAVRAYLRARYRMPSVSQAMCGAGVYGLSRAGHDRLGSFPLAANDDLLVDRLFAPGRKIILSGPAVAVRMPRTAKDLLDVLVRSRRGIAEQSLDTGALSLKELLGTITGPRSAVDAACFVGFALAVRYRTAQQSTHPVRTGGAQAWERDDSTRWTPLPHHPTDRASTSPRDSPSPRW
jgi:GT2 family glycosyltransferase